MPTTIKSSNIPTGTVTADDLASTLDISGKTVTLPETSVTTHVTQTDTTGIEDDIALLGFKVAANGSLAKYNLVDQTIDAFEDASGVDASASTAEIRNTANNYYSGFVAGLFHRSTFTTVESTTWTAPAGINSTNYLVVAGGGGGGAAYYSAGGGAGGFRTGILSTTPASSYAVTVGAGGAGSSTSGTGGTTGGDSIFSSITSDGGGGGGAYTGTTSGESIGKDGGSGGGGSGSGSATEGGVGGSATAGQGYDGGVGNYRSGGGGGGAGAVGGEGDPDRDEASGVGGDGGVGLSSDLSGSAVFYAGGGGGGASSNVNSSGVGGDGGNGGGGRGAGGHTVAATAGTANTGGGGGGASFDTSVYSSGKDGGSGIVILTGTASGDNNDMTLVSEAVTAESPPPTTGDLVITYTDGLDASTINVDLKAYISRDGSAYTSAVTLVSQGTTGGHTILTANGVDLSGITSGTSMKWKIETLNQGASKETRIQAVSLGWS